MQWLISGSKEESPVSNENRVTIRKLRRRYKNFIPPKNLDWENRDRKPVDNIPSGHSPSETYNAGGQWLFPKKDLPGQPGSYTSVVNQGY